MTSEYKMTLPARTPQDAEPAARARLEKAQGQLGFVPNMYGGMANSPGLLETYVDGYDRFRASSGFSPAEQEVVFLVVSRGNGCEYCVAAHSLIAERMSRVPKAVITAIREGSAIPDPRLAALGVFTFALLSTRGRPSRADVEAFLAAGFQERQILEIILAIAVKTLSNYSNHLFHTPLDPMFADHEWKREAGLALNV